MPTLRHAALAKHATRPAPSHIKWRAFAKCRVCVCACVGHTPSGMHTRTASDARLSLPPPAGSRMCRASYCIVCRLSWPTCMRAVIEARRDTRKGRTRSADWCGRGEGGGPSAGALPHAPPHLLPTPGGLETCEVTLPPWLPLTILACPHPARSPDSAHAGSPVPRSPR